VWDAGGYDMGGWPCVTNPAAMNYPDEMASAPTPGASGVFQHSYAHTLSFTGFHNEETVKIYIAAGDPIVGTGASYGNLRDYLDGKGATPDDAGGYIYVDPDTKVRYEIHLIMNEANFSGALQTNNAYIAFQGHSNYGIGYAWQNPLATIPDFFNVGGSFAAVPTRWLQASHTNPAIRDKDIATQPRPKNYNTDLGFERFPNVVGDFEAQYILHVGINSEFPKIYGNGQNRFHYYAKEGNQDERIIVRSRYTGCDDVPKKKMKYKWLLLDSCNSGPYYGDSFKQGTVFYAENLGAIPNDALKLFVEAIIEGHDEKWLKEALNGMDVQTVETQEEGRIQVVPLYDIKKY